MVSQLYCQNNFGVWGKSYSVNNKKYVTVFLYKEYFKNISGCKLNLATANSTNDSLFFIIGDTLCDGTNKAYIVIVGSTGYLMDPKQFYNHSEIEESMLKIKNNYPDVKEREKLAITYVPIFLEELNKEKLKNQIKTLDSVTKLFDEQLLLYSKNNWVLWEWSFGYKNEYSSFVNIDITVLNPFKKRIKYIWFTFRAYNPVDDPVKDGISGKIEITTKGIGPIEYGDKADYNFDNVFYSKVITKMKITAIKIQFFDGSAKVINNPIEMTNTGD